MTEDFNCDLNVGVDLENILPQETKYKIINCLKSKSGMSEVTLKVALFSPEEIKLWVRSLEKSTSCTYSIIRTGSCTGERILFKQFLNCHHNTRSKKLYDPTIKNRTKNTNCPSSLTVTLQKINKKFRGKSENAPDPEMPCIIVFKPTHNHTIISADALRFRRVCDSTKKKLMDLFKLGHSPATALETIKIDIQLSIDDYEKHLADRSVCPDYNYCHYLFMKEFRNLYGPIEFNEEGKKKLIERLKEYNSTAGDECSQIYFKDTSYVITLCPPLFKRIHENISSSSEIVFLDSTGTVDHDGSKVFIMSTNSECGGLPLGLIITSSESIEHITMGFAMLKSMLRNKIFNGKVEGPQVFMTDDCDAEHISIKSTWSNSKCLLCVFHVLQAVYRWLVSSKNGIPKDTAIIFFKQFRAIVYAPTITKCEEQYEAAVEAAKDYINYIQYLNSYWQRRDMWAISFRTWLLVKGNHTNNISEAAMRLLKDKIFNRVKAFNIIQLVDFLLTKFVDYYKRRLLDAAHNRQLKDRLLQTIALPPIHIINNIQKLEDNIYLVPSEHKENLHYVVYTDMLICTCFHGNTGVVCKHVDWVHLLYHSDAYQKKIDNLNIRNKLFKIATGNIAPSNWLLPLNKLPESALEINEVNDAIIVEPESDVPEEDNSSVRNGDNSSDILLKAVDEGQLLIKEFSESLAKFVKESPLQTVPALRNMLEKLKKVKTVNGFVSSCATFGSEFHRKNLGSRIPVQPTAIARRKTNIAGKASHVGGRPRRTINGKIKKKTPHKISKYIVKQCLKDKESQISCNLSMQ